MIFRVSYKGITKHSGRLESVFDFLVKQWGSAEKAFEIGVKVEAMA